MLGFLFKILFVAIIVVGVGYVVMTKRGLPIPKTLSEILPKSGLSALPLNKDALTQAKDMKPDQVIAQVSGLLDSLVTHEKPGSPVVLGISVTNKSLGAVADAIHSLPKDQLDELKNALCSASPAASQ